jgi:hypothetical protein
MIILLDSPIQIGLQFFDRVIDLFAKGHLVELILNGAVEAFANAVSLRVAGFGLGVVDIFNGQIQLIFMVFQRTTELGAAVRKDPDQANILLFEKKQDAVIEHVRRYQGVFAVIELGEPRLWCKCR